MIRMFVQASSIYAMFLVFSLVAMHSAQGQSTTEFCTSTYTRCSGFYLFGFCIGTERTLTGNQWCQQFNSQEPEFQCCCLETPTCDASHPPENQDNWHPFTPPDDLFANVDQPLSP